MSVSGFPDFLEFSSVNLTNIAGIVHCCGKIPADRKSFEIIKTLAIRRLLSKDLKRRSEVNLKAIFNRFSIRNKELKSFLLRIQEAIQDSDIAVVDDLIIRREVSLKGSKRAKTCRVGEYKEQSTGWIGIDILDYRYTPAKRIIKDIMNAEVV